MEKLEWYFNLIDKMSGPAERINRSLGAVERRLQNLQAQSARLARPTGGGLGELATSLNQGIDLAGRFANGLGSIASAAVGAAASLGRYAVDQAVFHQSTMTSLNATLHSQGPGAGAREFSRSIQLANLTPADTNEIVASRRQLATLFQNNAERDAVFALQEDLANLNPDDAGQIRGGLTRLLGQVRGADRLQGNDYLQLQTAGLSPTEILDQVAQAQHFSGSQASQRAQARTRLGTRGHGNEAINAMIHAVEARTGSRIGGFTLAQGNSLSGLMSNLHSAPDTLMQQLFLQTGQKNGGNGTAAFAPLQNMLRQVGALFDSATPRGARLFKLVDRLLVSFGSLFNVNGATLESTFDTVLGLITSVVDAGQWLWRNVVGPFGSGVWQVVRSTFPPIVAAFSRILGTQGGATNFAAIAERIGLVVGGVLTVGLTAAASAVSILYPGYLALADVFNAVTASYQGLVANFQDTFAVFEQIGTAISQGIATGIQSGWQQVTDTITALAASLPEPVRNVLGIHSPSTVFAGFGGYTAEGFALGIEGGSGRVGDALGGMLALPELGGFGAGGKPGAAGGGFNVGGVSIAIQVPPGNYDAEALARAAAELLPSRLLEALEPFAIARGVG